MSSGARMIPSLFQVSSPFLHAKGSALTVKISPDWIRRPSLLFFLQVVLTSSFHHVKHPFRTHNDSSVYVFEFFLTLSKKIPLSNVILFSFGISHWPRPPTCHTVGKAKAEENFASEKGRRAKRWAKPEKHVPIHLLVHANLRNPAGKRCIRDRGVRVGV